MSVDQIHLIVLLRLLIDLIQTINFGIFAFEKRFPLVIIESKIHLWPTVTVSIVEEFTEVRSVAEQFLWHTTDVDTGST